MRRGTLSKTLTHEYSPRDIFLPFHERIQRWAIIVAHRRCGKTIATINDLIGKGAYSQKPAPRYAYIAPFYSQAKAIAWDYLKKFSEGLKPKISEAALSVEFPHNNARISLYGADNADSLRGIYLDGVVLDEYGLMKPAIFSEVLRPTLADRKGWATFIGTPNGANAFYDVWENAQADAGWYSLSLPHSATNLLSAEEVADLRRIMTVEEFEQELNCSFTASMRGSFYGTEIKAAEDEDRIGHFPPDPDLPIHYVFDLGFSDDTAIIGWQESKSHLRIVYHYAANGRPIAHYTDLLHSLPHMKGTIWLPHDARARSLQTGKSIVEQFLKAGIRPKLVPNLDVLDGIQATRLTLPYCQFHAPATPALLKSLRLYHREWSAERKCFLDRPLHDYTSHDSDAFRYLSLCAVRKAHVTQIVTQDPMQPGVQAAGQFNLNQLFNDRESIRYGR